ncbi:MAG TPA: hypothetical protein VID70_10710 [Solirubrobacteraceae bacterium]
MAVEHLLHLLEGRWVDQGGMASGALGAVERDDPDVVVVAEDAVDHAARERLAWPRRGGAGSQAGILEDVGDGGDGVLSGGA